MKNYVFGAAAVLAASFAATPVVAADPTVTLTAGVVSDYTFRGISQTNENPALQLGGEIALPTSDWLAIYAGLWGSNVDLNNGAEAEIDAYGGLRATFDKLGVDVGFIRYIYTGRVNDELDYTEGKLAVSYDFGFVLPSAAIYYSPEFYNDSGSAVYYTAGVSVPIPVTQFAPTIKANVGRQHIDDNAAFGITKDSYMDWNIGLFATYWGFTAGVQYVDTNLTKRECGNLDICEARAVFSLGYTYSF
jgi:uncharacterized protein (TIGR02001 family)